MGAVLLDQIGLLSSGCPDLIVLPIPTDDEDCVLHLSRMSIYTANSKVCSSQGCQSPVEGCNYSGVVKGHENDSLAAITIADDEIMGIIQLHGHQHVLGNYGKTGYEVFYRDDQLQVSKTLGLDHVRDEEKPRRPLTR